MKKRIFTVCIASIISVTMFAGCGQKNEPAAVSNSGNDNGLASTSSGDGGSGGAVTDDGYQIFDDVKLSMLICWNGGFKTASDQYNNPVATAIRDKIGVTVEFESIMMSETEKLNLMFASGDMPDIVNAPYWGGNAGETEVIKKAASEGRLLPIEDLLPNYPNIEKGYEIGVISQKYLEMDLEPEIFNGHRYIIPQETGGNLENINNWNYGVFVRGDVPDALGIDPSSIKTPDQLYDFMVQAKEYGFKDVNGNDTITASTFHEGWDYSRYVEGFKTQSLTDYIDNGDGTVGFKKLSQNWMDENMFIWKLVNEDILDKECFRHTGSQADEKVGNGSALFVASQYGTAITATKLTNLYISNPELRYVPVGPMQDVDGNPLYQVEAMGRSGSPGIFFPTTCSNLEAAMTYIDYVNSEEGARLCQYGIEGETYVMNDDGQPRLIPDILERKKAGDSTWEDDMREAGATYIRGRLGIATLNKTWWGESNVGDADAAVEELEAYYLARPVKQLPGYPIDVFVTQFPEYDRVRSFAFEGTTEKDYKERAYFARTEDEARAILESYQEYLRTQENGLFIELLDFLAEQATTRDDIAF